MPTWSPGGTFLVSEFPFPEDEEDCRTVPGRLMCGARFSKPTSAASCFDRPVRRPLERAGFREVGVIDVTPVHVVVHGTE